MQICLFNSYRQGCMAITTHTEQFNFSFHKQSALGCSRDSMSSFLSLETCGNSEQGRWPSRVPFCSQISCVSPSSESEIGYLGCNVNTLCPTSDFEGLSKVSVSREGRGCPVLQSPRASSPPLNCSGCPNACRCSSRALTILRSWLAHRSPLLVTPLAWGTRHASCWTHCSGCWSLGNFLPRALYLAINREQCKTHLIYWAFSWLLSWMPSVWTDEDHPG